MSLSFADILVKRLKGKVVEVYSGDNAIKRLYSDSEVTIKEVIRGKVIDSEEDLLIIEVDNNGKNNLVYINTYNVRSVVEPKNGLSIIDLYSQEQEKIRK